jgi:mono/diheme cytochrome c family protein
VRTRQPSPSHQIPRRILAQAALLVACVTTPLSVAAGEPDPKTRAEHLRFFEQYVRPLLAQRCYSCHGEKKQKAGLRLDSLEAIKKGGESGPAIAPSKPELSLLMEAINYRGPEMPPTGKLGAQEIALLTRWVALGAPWPDGDRRMQIGTPGDNDAARSIQMADHRDFWAIRPVATVSIPSEHLDAAASWEDWSRNPIDAFILSTLLKRGLAPAPEADKPTLIRRVTFDLTGLPPTPEEVDAFLADQSPNAYERLVDRLMASPRYGERWGRHWLDLVRYAESDGFRQDALRPHAWRFRDYVVRAFNTDKPYDRFLTEQLAGDEVDPDDPELKIATGYYRLGPYEYNQRDVRGQWADILNEITDVTGEVFLGLSVGCARCHDHKFDPILQRDYYRLQAFFAPLSFRDDMTLARTRERALHRSRQAAWEKDAVSVLRELAALEQPYRDKGRNTALAKFPDDIRAILLKPDKDRSPLERQLGALAFRQIAYEYDQVPAQLKGFAKDRWTELRKALKIGPAAEPQTLEPVLAVTDVGPVSPPTCIPGAGKREPIEPGFLSALDPTPARIEPSRTVPESTGRRLALARWLSSPDNPLSTRVIVNRVWQYHFGRGLVGTSSDFGRLGDLPSHPELLDWLTADFIASGWRLKPLHRLILSSMAYRQSARRNPSALLAAERVDPENRLLWRQTVRRLDADEIRDAMLAASGELAQLIGGPSVPPAQPRRTIDTRLVRNTLDGLLGAFDAPDGNRVVSRRDTTTTATQALFLINGDWALSRARALAVRVERCAPPSTDDRERVVLVYRLVFSRDPDGEEVTAALAFLRRQSTLTVRSPERINLAADRAAFIDFCHVIFNSNEFVYLD